jgi:hypothetical protein
MTRLWTMLLAACALWAAMPTASQAQGAFGCACMHNQTGMNIHFRYKWGNEDWRNRQVGAGQNYSICWNYGSGPHTSPSLLFQLDRDMGPGAAWTTYTINRGQSPQNNCAFTHPASHYDIRFQAGTNNSFIQVTHRGTAGAPPPQPGPGPMPGPAPGTGQAAFGCACVNNGVGAPIQFQYRWGPNQQFNTRTLLPGHVYAFCWSYGAGPHTSPPLEFMLNRAVGGAPPSFTDYNLPRVQSPTNQCAGVPRQGHYWVRFQPGTNNQFLHVSR